MATYGYTFTSGDTLTPTKLNNARTVTDIVNADIGSAAEIGLSKLETGALPTAITVATANILEGNVTLAKLVSAVQQALVPVGAVQAFARSTAPAGWLSANGNTIGSASSGATNASADYSALFAVLWDNWTNTALPILTSGGSASTRGADAAADFAANKRLPLPNLNGIFIRGAGSAQTIGGNSYSGTFAAKQEDEFRSHTHAVENFAATTTPGGAVTINQTFGNKQTGATGGDETRPANIALLYCIKF